MTDETSRRLFIKQTGATVLSVFALPNILSAQTKQSAEGLRTDLPADKLIADLQKYIPALMKQINVPGVSIALIRDAKILWTQGFGVKNAITREPVTTDTPFEAASLSLPAFAYATLMLSDQGKLKLDAPLWNYLPDYFLPADDPNSKLISARMILSHTSGLFMQKNLLQPLGMQNSSYDWTEEYEKTAAKGHNEAGERVSGKNFYEKYRGFSAEQKARIRDLQPEDAAPSAAFSLTSTPADYARFMIEIMRPTEKDKSRLPENLIAEMFKPQAKVTDAIAWGLGWGLEHTTDGDAFWHWGNASTFQHFVVGYKKQGIGIVIMTNSANGLRLCKELTPRAISGEYTGFGLLLK